MFSAITVAIALVLVIAMTVVTVVGWMAVFGHDKAMTAISDYVDNALTTITRTEQR